MENNGIAAGIGRVELLHAIPGRIRLRVPEIKGDPARAREVEHQVTGLKVVRRAEVSPVTGSLLVTYDPDDLESLEELGRRLIPELELTTLTASSDPAPDMDMDVVTPSMVAGIMGHLRTMNANVRTTTGGLDLRILVPALLVLLGVKKLVTDREKTPTWYNYFWFAFGTFCTLNRRATTGAGPPNAVASPAVVNGNGETGEAWRGAAAE